MTPKLNQYKEVMDWKNAEEKGQVGLGDWVSGGGGRLDKKKIKPEEQLCKVGNETDRTGASFSKKNDFFSLWKAIHTGVLG